ncbi:MAG: hypothetical protein ABIK98_12790 [Pseudomonadota bacterium]
MSQLDDEARYEKISREFDSACRRPDVSSWKVRDFAMKTEEASRANLLREQLPPISSGLLYDQRYDHRIKKVEKDIIELKEMYSKLAEEKSVVLIKINRLQKRKLKEPLEIIVEPDDEGFLARTADMPLYGCGDDRIEAVDMLKREIESLYDDLMEGDNFSEEYLKIKFFLSERVVD